MKAGTISSAVAATCCVLGIVAPTSADATTLFNQTDLVTDSQSALADEGFAPAVTVDPNLINPWGMSSTATSPFWVSNQATGKATLYSGQGVPQPAGTPLVVGIPANPTPPTGPTGQVANTIAGGFVLSTGGKTGPASFMFANLDGSISAWNATGDRNSAVQVVPPSSTARPASYTGLTILGSGASAVLLAANNRAGTIDVFDQNFHATTLPGTFSDPTASSGLVPFNVRAIGDRVYVAYAPPGRTADQAPLGTGFVNVFNTSGQFVQRLTTGGPLASPWGLTMAPANFGSFSNALLVGNFDGQHGNINAFDPLTGAFLGTLRNADGTPIALPDLWSLEFGNGATAGPADSLFFTAGIGDEMHGLFGELTAVPEPATLALLASALGLGAGARWRRARAAASA